MTTELEDQLCVAIGLKHILWTDFNLSSFLTSSHQMITGDHLNIAKETARLIGMGTNIYAGEATRDPTKERNDLIWAADGFAQVLPKDKREVVLVLKDVFKIIVGMTGDGELQRRVCMDTILRAFDCLALLSYCLDTKPYAPSSIRCQ